MDFDTPVDWSDADLNRVKMLDRFGLSPDDAIPMWIADMELRSPDCIADAIRAKTDLNAFSYFDRSDALKEAMRWWMEERHGWDVDPEHVLISNGLGNALGILFNALVAPDEAVMIFTPVYHQFAARIRAAGRTAIEVPLAVEDGRQTFDIDAAEAARTDKTRMIVLCSPQNPGARVWTMEELTAICDFAARHDMIVVSDEIHQDLIYPGHTFIPAANVPGVSDRLVTLSSPSKTFNIAGLRCGQMTIPDEHLRKKVADTIESLCIQPHRFGMEGVIAAYSREGAAWVDALMAYLEGNRAVFLDAMASIPGAKPMPMEGSYLSWVDFSGTGMSEAEIKKRIVSTARVAAYTGSVFGPGGENYVRFNIATQRARLEEAASRIRDAFSDLQ